MSELICLRLTHLVLCVSLGETGRDQCMLTEARLRDSSLADRLPVEDLLVHAGGFTLVYFYLSDHAVVSSLNFKAVVHWNIKPCLLLLYLAQFFQTYRDSARY